MRRGKWQNCWRVVFLSAISGLFSSAMYLMAYRAEEYLAELRYQEELAREALNPSGVIACRFDHNPLWWVDASIWNIILFIVVGLVAHRYLARRVRSVFLLWQCIGATVIAAWGLTILMGVILDGYSAGGGFPLERILEGIIYPSNQRSALKFVSLMLGINVIYGTIMQVAAKCYGPNEVE
jgi:hypothetical protein